MKIRNNIDLIILENYRYKYEENLIFPTYKRVIRVNKNQRIIIEILIKDRTIFINKNSKIKRDHLKYLNDLRKGNLLVE